MFHGPNSTNIHTHGLHIDPVIDTVFKEVGPSERYTYKYQIPSDHAPGIHWYHSHKHGASSMQIMGGLFGAIIVDPSSASAVPAALTNLTRVTLLFSHFSTSTVNTLDDPFKVRTYLQLASMTGDAMNVNPTYVSSSVTDIYFTNGQYQPQYTMQPGQSVIFDIVHATGDHNIDVEIRTAINGGSSACTMVVLALDGVYLRTARTVTFVVMIPAQRASIMVTCPTAGTYYMQTNPNMQTRPDAGDYEIRFAQNLLTLQVSGSTVSSAATPDLSTIVRPTYLNDLTSVTTTNTWELSIEQTKAPRDMAWLGMGSNCSFAGTGRGSDPNLPDYDPTTNTNCKYEVFPGVVLNSTTTGFRHKGTVDTVEELTINGRGLTPHSIHVHVHHMQVISDSSNKYQPTFGQYGDFRDTVPALVGRVKVRYTMNRFAGESVVHCHFLFHEDMGMMGSIYAGSNTCAYPASGCESVSPTTPTASPTPAPPGKKVISQASSTVLSITVYVIAMVIAGLVIAL